MRPFPIRASLFVLSVVLAFSLVLTLKPPVLDTDTYPKVFPIVLLIVAASYFGVHHSAGGVIRPTGTVLYLVLFLFEPPLGSAIAFIGQLVGGATTRGWVAWRAIFNAAQFGLSVFVGSHVYRALGGTPSASIDILQVAIAVVAVLVLQTLNNIFVTFFFRQISNIPFASSLLRSMRSLLASMLLGIPAAMLVAILYERVHPFAVLGLFVILPFEFWSLQLYSREKEVHLRTLEALVRASEMSEPGSRGHARRVADLSVLVARRLGLAEDQIESVEFAALVHDIGMIAFDKVSVEDPSLVRELLRVHALKGAEIVSEFPRKEVREMVLHHHALQTIDQPDSSGQISLGARIIALAEELDSRMHGLFPHMRPVSLEEARRLVISGRTSPLDTVVAQAFLEAYEEENDRIAVGPGVLDLK